ncbi:MAG: DUF4190 domain-containing protein [Planctomycetia bacterium]|nr:DUF4190 domain-containing protein [Planctomycetia bacterium]
MKTEFDDALRGIYHEYDEVRSEEQTADYKQVGTLAVCSLCAALISILGFFWMTFILFAAAGIVLGFLALRKILKAPEEMSGFSLSTIGIGLSLLIGISAACWQAWCFYHEAPPGYDVVDFNTMAIDPKTGKVPDDIVEKDGRKVFIKGFMYPTNRQSGIEDFTMVRTLAHCKFCSPGTNPADMISVELEKGMAVNYRANKMVSVGGILHVEPNFKAGEIPYSIEANVFR